MGVSREEEGENPNDAGQGDGEADFGEADAEIPQRAMPDYGDVIDEGEAKEEADDNLGQGLKSAPRPGSKVRPEAIHIAGAQRLGATHFSAILALKDLPKFVRLEWVSDNEVLLVFNEVKEAAAALKSLQEGFDNVPETVGGKDPGVWRARRGMLEFRQATADDVPPMGFKRQKRAGRQVHEYRLWAAEQAADMSVDEEEGVTVASQAKKLGLKSWRDWRKRATREQGGITDDEDIDLLAQMSQQDKEILAQEPGANGHAADELWFEPARGRKRQWEASTWYGDDDAWWGSVGGDDSWGSSRGRQGQSWWCETGWNSWNDGPRNRWEDDSGGRSAKRRRGGADGDGGTLATKEENPGSARQGQERRGDTMAADVDEEERSRRQKRQERFKAQAAKAEGATSGASSQPPAGAQAEVVPKE